MRLTILPLVAAILLTTIPSASAVTPPTTAGTGASITAPPPWKYKNQEEWMAANTMQDIAEMLTFAAAQNKKRTFAPQDLEFSAKQIDAESQKYSYSVKSPELPEPLTGELTFKKCLLDTNTYAEFAQKLVEAMKLTPQDSTNLPSATELLEELSKNTSETLHAQNERVSKALTQTPLSAGLHEQAAMVVSTFSLLDMSTSFYDKSAWQSRMAAHLGIARALRGASTSPFIGKLAEASLCGQSSRDTEATERVAALEPAATTENEKSWVRTVKLVATNDPRVFPKSGFTPVEEYQYAMRLAFFHDGDRVAEYMTSRHYQPNIQWLRLINNGRTSVGVGHMFTASHFPAEIADFAKDYKLWMNSEFNTAKDIAAEANREPTRCMTGKEGQYALSAISWPDVASWHQRQICAGFLHSYYFQNSAYAVKENAKEIVEVGKKTLSDFRLYPFVALPWIDSKEIDTPLMVTRAVDTVKNAPYLVPPLPWTGSSRVEEEEAKTKGLKELARQWFGSRPLFGTAYMFSLYWEDLDSKKLDVATLQKLRDIAIYNRHVCTAYAMEKYGHYPTGEQWEEAYGKMIEFDETARWRAAYGDFDTPEKFIARMEKICVTDKPDHYFSLAKYCWNMGRKEDTAKYFQLGMMSDADDIGKANVARWWVLHLYDTGRKKEAQETAEFAAAVYSHGGLKSMAFLLERQNKLPQAEEYYKKIQKRYDADLPLYMFYRRHEKTNPQYKQLAADYIKKKYNGEFQPDSPPADNSAPKDGAIITNAQYLARHFGLKKGDIITGFNGYRIKNMEEKYAIEELTLGELAKVTYWDGKAYKHVNIPTLDNKIGIDMDNYKPGMKLEATADDE
jgi:hypothetical protein